MNQITKPKNRLVVERKIKELYPSSKVFFRDSRNHADLTRLDFHQSVRRERSRCGHESRSNEVEAPLQRARQFCLTKVCGLRCSYFFGSGGFRNERRKNKCRTCRHGDYQKMLTWLLLSSSIWHSQAMLPSQHFCPFATYPHIKILHFLRPMNT